MTETAATQRHLRTLSTPRAAAVAGVLFAILFAAALILIRTTLPEHPQIGTQWIESGRARIRVAAILMPFAGIMFLWFIGVVRDGFGHFEDKFFSSVFLGSGLLFLAMTFVASAVGVALSSGDLATSDSAARMEIAAFGQMLLMTLTKTYALRMAAVFMMSLATIWLKTSLMPRWLVMTTYVVVLAVMLAADVSMWIALAFPAWVLVVSLFVLNRSGVIDLDPRAEDASSSDQT
ncbi:hypothetical protein TUM20983_49570 [Mycobacterium antarcticum]|uniref:hypothetical protein n=1 Tax=Mycolicibacterium sp. TUM20983 TaxID=3023369 RepID=UPI0023909C97|nr:hypothetical protein [Mycolicibacterium sp. TUM20983]GLP77847.1 hypothetical protein TUM20983_49570 [Mycolicibacterium sp. TUM20983]